mgnify:FL=1
MSEKSSRRLRPKDVAMLVKSGGDFAEETRFSPQSGGGFVPWGKTNFKVLKAEDALNSNEPQESEQETASPEASAHADHTAPVETQSDHVETAAAEIPPAAPPAGPQDVAPSSADIIAEIDKAREDGRVIGYQQGLTAGRQEFEAALDVLRRLEERIVPLADEAIAKNTEVIARHVRRIAQDLSGTMFATIPDAFVQRIHRAAETFTRANMEFTLAINPKDAEILIPALRGDEMFKDIRVNEDHALPSGGFKITARDLEVEDFPQLLGAGDDE